ncbi:PREDICTED: transmembrane protein 81 [Condylura cristata]|uniref:transmembrane protein 81 n=1 Tax=Condylura cristata TaxID=143302 RepID=UPI0006438A1C|nr:PREDICTED: transmembrane protein 81 [Condylura cristata]
MISLAVSITLGNLMLASCLSSGVTTPKTLAIPKEMKEVVGEVVIHTTPCSITCGLGSKEDTVCEVGPDGVRRKCRAAIRHCLTTWHCGMHHFTVHTGRTFVLNCMGSQVLGLTHASFQFTWRVARGIISVDDGLFRPFLFRHHSLKFISVREHDSGTYRCDMYLLRNMKLVKRLYFGLRVLPSHLVKLNFLHSLTEGQKLMDEGLEVDLDNGSLPLHHQWKKKMTVIVAIGVTAGLVGMLMSIFLCSRLGMLFRAKTRKSASRAVHRKRRRRRRQQQQQHHHHHHRRRGRRKKPH